MLNNLDLLSFQEQSNHQFWRERYMPILHEEAKKEAVEKIHASYHQYVNAWL
jgi:hypothetical protein